MELSKVKIINKEIRLLTESLRLQGQNENKGKLIWENKENKVVWEAREDKQLLGRSERKQNKEFLKYF